MCQSHGKPLHLQLPSPVSCHPPLRCIFLPWHKTHLAQIYPSVFASSSTCSKREYTQQERCTTILFCSQHQRVDLKFLWTAQAYSHNGTYLCYQPPNCHNQYCEIHVVGRSPIVQPGELTRSRYHFCDFVTPVTRVTSWCSSNGIKSTTLNVLSASSLISSWFYGFSSFNCF